MEHHFDVNVAIEYGIAEAVIINNFQWWIRKNKANGVHLHDNRTWTYNSQKALTDLFPYLSRQSLRTAIKHLCDNGVIMVGNFNDDPFKKINWYAFVDEERWIGGIQPEHELIPTDGMVDSNQRVVDSNLRMVDSNQYTDNKYTDNKDTNIKQTNKKPSIPKKEKKGLDLSFVSIEYLGIIEKWLQHKKQKRQYYTQVGIESQYRRLLKMSNNDARIADIIVEYSIAQNYDGIFMPDELKQKNHGSNFTEAQQPRNRFCDLARTIKANGGIF